MICKKIIVLFCSTMFIIHSIICVFKEISTPKKAVDVTPVRLSSMDFPLLFGISINPGSRQIYIFTSPNAYIQASMEHDFLNQDMKMFGIILGENEISMVTRKK